MSTALIERPVPPFADAFEGRTLEDLLAVTWEQIRADSPAACPVCGGSLTPRYGAGPQPVAGRCEECGSRLS